jgi:hypothetical protein
MTVHESDRKLGELILYVSEKSAYDLFFGSVKLNKILYFSDFLAYGNRSESITGAEYRHLKQGPAPTRLVEVRDALVAAGDLAIQPIQFPDGKTQYRPVNRRKADISQFRPEHIEIVDWVIEQLKGLNATETSDLSHLELGWRLTREYETIDYRTVFLSDQPLSDADLRRLSYVMKDENAEKVA